jgi:hypothetical protein
MLGGGLAIMMGLGQNAFWSLLDDLVSPAENLVLVLAEVTGKSGGELSCGVVCSC